MCLTVDFFIASYLNNNASGLMAQTSGGSLSTKLEYRHSIMWLGSTKSTDATNLNVFLYVALGSLIYMSD